MLDPDQLLRRNPDVHVETFGDESVVFACEANTLHHLNETATMIWTLADGRSLADVLDTLGRRFPAEAAEVAAHTQELVEVLLRLGLVTADRQRSDERENLVKEA